MLLSAIYGSISVFSPYLRVKTSLSICSQLNETFIITATLDIESVARIMMEAACYLAQTIHNFHTENFWKLDSASGGQNIHTMDSNAEKTQHRWSVSEVESTFA